MLEIIGRMIMKIVYNTHGVTSRICINFCAVCYIKAKKTVKVNAKETSNYIIPYLTKKSIDFLKK